LDYFYATVLGFGHLSNRFKKTIMQRTRLIATGLIITAFSILGCSVDNGTTCPSDFTGELSASETGLVGKWTLTDMVADESIDLTNDNTDNPSTNIYQQYTECQTDVVYNFNSDRSYHVEVGYVASNCDNKQALDGTWKMQADQIAFVSSCTTQTVDIMVIDSNTFTFTSMYRFVDVHGVTVNTSVTSTYEKSL